MLFCYDIQDRKKILAKKSKEDKPQKAMASFSKLKYILMFGKPLCFIYKSPDKFEEVAKWKFLGNRRYAKYNPDNKY